MKSVEAHRNVLNRGLGELAAECGGAAEAWWAPKEIFDVGVRGRFRPTQAESVTPQSQMTCSRGRKGKRPFAMVLRENLWDWLRAPRLESEAFRVFLISKWKTRYRFGRFFSARDSLVVFALCFCSGRYSRFRV